MPILLFDIDGTLVRTGGAGKAAMEAALCEEFGVELTAGEIPYGGRTDPAIKTDLLSAHGIDPSPANLEKLREGYLARLPAALRRNRGAVCPPPEDLLATLRTRADVVLGLLTGNVRRGAEAKLGHYGLWGSFTCGGFGDGCLHRNDVARAAVRSAAERTGRSVRPDEVWVIGDTPLDVSCGRAVGARVVAVATGWTPLQELVDTAADVVLGDLSDHGELLRLWA
jgi:phosphoglycolate phosphatase-like HAD superfamily hydrolase